MFLKSKYNKCTVTERGLSNVEMCITNGLNINSNRHNPVSSLKQL